MPVDLRALVYSQKTMSVVPGWEIRDAYYRLFAPLDIAGVTVQGLELRGSALLQLPDKAVSLQLQFHRPGGRMAQLYRIEWRPIKGHNNKQLGPPKLRNMLLAGSHEHAYDANLRPGSALELRSSLPVALPINPDPATFPELLVFAGAKLNISNMSAIPTPPWEPELGFVT